VESADGGCATPVATWTQTSGPALEQASFSGTSVDVRTQSTGLDVVGQAIDFDVTVGDGSGATATGRHRVLLVAEPFVEISEATAPFPPREEESVLVTVRLANGTACDVGGLEVRETLDGLTPALDTLRLGGVAVPGSFVSGTLTVRDVALAAGETQTLTFQARRRLLARGQLTGTVLLRGQVVSLRPAAPVTTTGCGCHASGASGVWALVLAMLVLARREVARRSWHGKDDDRGGLVDDAFGEAACGVGACLRTVSAGVQGAADHPSPGRDGITGVGPEDIRFTAPSAKNVSSVGGHMDSWSAAPTPAVATVRVRCAGPLEATQGCTTTPDAFRLVE
jgi:MYXO-CTERM domain-containing protein